LSQEEMSPRCDFPEGSFRKKLQKKREMSKILLQRRVFTPDFRKAQSNFRGGVKNSIRKLERRENKGVGNRVAPGGPPTLGKRQGRKKPKVLGEMVGSV